MQAVRDGCNSVAQLVAREVQPLQLRQVLVDVVVLWELADQRTAREVSACRAAMKCCCCCSVGWNLAGQRSGRSMCLPSGYTLRHRPPSYMLLASTVGMHRCSMRPRFCWLLVSHMLSRTVIEPAGVYACPLLRSTTRLHSSSRTEERKKCRHIAVVRGRRCPDGTRPSAVGYGVIWLACY